MIYVDKIKVFLELLRIDNYDKKNLNKWTFSLLHYNKKNIVFYKLEPKLKPL